MIVVSTYNDYWDFVAYARNACLFCERQNMTVREAYEYLRKVIYTEYNAILCPESSYQPSLRANINYLSTSRWLADNTGIVVINFVSDSATAPDPIIFEFPIERKE